MNVPRHIRTQISLRSMTTLGVGGVAEYYLSSDNLKDIADSVAWARRAGMPITVLGGGSNIIINDDGVDGLVIRFDGDDWSSVTQNGVVHLTLGAGLDWDEVVRRTVACRWAGIECLVGIPGRVGAAPIQNIGAYGQELADSAVSVDVLDLSNGATARFSSVDCQFGYRTSRFKTVDRGRFLVTAVTLQLTPNGVPTVKYQQLKTRVPDASNLDSVMKTVVELRREKSMLAGMEDCNARSVGSFFLNPIVDDAMLDALRTKAELAGVDVAAMPVWPVQDMSSVRRYKVPAAWLIERAGMTKGWGAGSVGLSTNHTLAIVNRGDASAMDVVGFAALVKGKVFNAFGIKLEPEPQFIGFSTTPV